MINDSMTHLAFDKHWGITWLNFIDEYWLSRTGEDLNIPFTSGQKLKLRRILAYPPLKKWIVKVKLTKALILGNNSGYFFFRMCKRIFTEHG